VRSIQTSGHRTGSGARDLAALSVGLRAEKGTGALAPLAASVPLLLLLLLLLLALWLLVSTDGIVVAGICCGRALNRCCNSCADTTDTDTTCALALSTHLASQKSGRGN
jgi:hypothetical protein